MDVAIAIDAEAVPVLLKRRAGDGYDGNGNAIKGSLVDANIMSAVQPASARMLQDLPEGLREEVSYVGWTRASISNDDVVVYASENHRVIHVWPRPQDSFNKYALRRSEA